MFIPIVYAASSFAPYPLAYLSANIKVIFKANDRANIFIAIQNIFENSEWMYHANKIGKI